MSDSRETIIKWRDTLTSSVAQEPSRNESVEDNESSTNKENTATDENSTQQVSFDIDENEVTRSEDFLVCDSQVEDNSMMISPTNAEDAIIVPSTPPHILDKTESDMPMSPDTKRTTSYNAHMEELDYEDDDEDWNKPTQVLSKETVDNVSSDDGNAKTSDESYVVNESVINMIKQESQEWNLRFENMDSASFLENEHHNGTKFDDVNGCSDGNEKQEINEEFRNNESDNESSESIKRSPKILVQDDSSDEENEIAPSQTSVQRTDVISRISSQESHLHRVTEAKNSSHFDESGKTDFSLKKHESAETLSLALSDNFQKLPEMQVVRASSIKISTTKEFELPATQKINTDASKDLLKQKYKFSDDETSLQLPETQALNFGDNDELPPTQVLKLDDNIEVHELPPTQIIEPLSNGHVDKHSTETKVIQSVKDLPETVSLNELSHTIQVAPEIPVDNLLKESSVIESTEQNVEDTVLKEQLNIICLKAADAELPASSVKDHVNSALIEAENINIENNKADNISEGQTTENESNEKIVLSSQDSKKLLTDEYVKSTEIKVVEESMSVDKLFDNAEVKVQEANVTSSFFADANQVADDHRNSSQMLPPSSFPKKTNGINLRKSMVSSVDGVKSPDKKIFEIPSLDVSDLKLDRVIGTFKNADELNTLMSSVGFCLNDEKLQAFARMSGDSEKLIFNKTLQCNIILKENTLIQKWIIMDQNENSPWSSVSNKTSSFTSLQSGDMADVSSIPSSNPSSKGSQSKVTSGGPSQENNLNVTAVTPSEIDFISSQNIETPIIPDKENSSQDDFQHKNILSLKRATKRTATKTLATKKAIQNPLKKDSNSESSETVVYPTRRMRSRSNQVDKSTSDSESSENFIKKPKARKPSEQKKSPKQVEYSNKKSTRSTKKMATVPDHVTPKLKSKQHPSLPPKDNIGEIGSKRKRKFIQPSDVDSPNSEENSCKTKRRKLTASPSKVPKSDVNVNKSKGKNVVSVNINEDDTKEDSEQMGKTIQHSTVFKNRRVQGRKRKLNSRATNENFVSLPTTPSADLTGNMNFSGTEGTVRKSKLFQGFAFLISEKARPQVVSSTSDSDAAVDVEKEIKDLIPFDRELLSREIKAAGGVILEMIEDVQKYPRRKALLVASTYLRTLKYFNCVACNIPCVKHDFVHNALSQRRVLDYRHYLLPTGFSCIKNQIIEWHSKADVFKGLKVLVTANKDKNDNFVENWALVLNSGKADVQKYTLPAHSNSGKFPVEMIVTNNTCPPNIVATAKRRKIPMVSFEWIIQCVISGIRHPYNAHEKFKYSFFQPGGSK